VFWCSLQLVCEAFFFCPGWIQSPHYVSAHKTLSTHCSRASRCRASVLWPEEAVVTRKRLLVSPGKTDTDQRSLILELANLNIDKHVHTSLLTYLLSLVYRIACCPRADQMLPTMLAWRKRLIGHDDAATFCSSFATVPSKDGRFALHTNARCCAQSFVWNSYDI
jgi:hypothetical protein